MNPATKLLPQPWMEALEAGKGSAMSRHGPSMPMGQGSWRLPRCCWASNWRSRTPKCLSSFVSYTGRRACCASNRRQAGRQNDIAVAPAPRHTVGHEAALPEPPTKGRKKPAGQKPGHVGHCRPPSERIDHRKKHRAECLFPLRGTASALWACTYPDTERHPGSAAEVS